jgi:pyridoxamine 5'-phosphate oxidase family protein
MFSEKERAYLVSQPLARLATIDVTGQPDADAVTFELDSDAIVIGSYHDLQKSRKYRNIAAGNTKVSIVIDSLLSFDPPVSMAVKIHGEATIEHRDGRFGPAEYLVIRPRTSWSWGVEGPAFVEGVFQPRKTVWTS